MSKREERKKLITKVINSATKKGADVSKVLNGKSIEEIVRMSNKNFERMVQRIKERPKLEKDLEKYEQKSFNNLFKRVSKKAKSQIDNAGLDTQTLKTIKGFEVRKNFPQFQPFTQAKNKKELLEMEKKLNRKPNLKKAIENYVSNHAKESLNRYFKELTLEPRLKDRIDILASSFGTRLDKFNDMVDILISDEFKVYTDGNIELKNDDADSFYDLMKNRLDRAEQIRKVL